MKQAKDSTGLKCRTLMYSQQLTHLPEGMSLQDLYSQIMNKLSPDMCACILHDKDLQEDGKTPAEPHVHMVMRWKNPRYISAVAKMLEEKPQQFEAWPKNYKNAFSYLIHATKNARHKYQYSATDVIANFNYIELIKEVTKEIEEVEKNNSKKKIEALLDAVGSGTVTRREAESQLTGSEYSSVANRLDKAHDMFLKNKAENLRKEMTENNETVKVYWFYGETETGKTVLATKLAEEMGEYYKSSTTRDSFQYYMSEPTIILEELRPKTIEYSELLAIFDPFSRGNVTVSSRYFNKPLAARVYIVTTPFSPMDFYKRCDVDDIDKGEQLYRRLTGVFKFTQEYIWEMEYNPDRGMYEYKRKKENIYSKKNMIVTIEDDMFERI